MNRERLLPAKILTGICVLAASSFAQNYTISAKPGAVNFIEGDVTVNGDPVWSSNLKSTFLNANDVISVKKGKAEVLLTPGVFLRMGENSEIRMLKPSLVETQVEVVSGESMIEVDDIVPGSSVAVMDHGSSTTLVKTGLYRFNETSIATLDGKAEVVFGDRHVDLKKNKEVNIDDSLHATKLDLNKNDDLYAWSNVRAQYDAAATYAGAREVYNNNSGYHNNSSYGYGSAFNSPGWYWNSPFNSFMWLPGNGAFYSPFGWGFYGPGVVAYAPVIAYPYYGYGGRGYYSGGGGGSTIVKNRPTTTATATTKTPAQMLVPVNPKSVGVPNFQGASPAAFAAARNQMQQAVAMQGLRTATGAPAANLQHGQTFANMQVASQAAANNAHSNAVRASSGGSGSSAVGRSGGGMAAPSMSSSAGAHVSTGGGHAK